MNTADLRKTIKITALKVFLFCFGTYVHIFIIYLVLFCCGFFDCNVTIVNDHLANQVQPNPRQLQFDDFVIELLVKTQFRVKELEEQNKLISAELEKENKSVSAKLDEQNKTFGASFLNLLRPNAKVSYTLEPLYSKQYSFLNELKSIICDIVRDVNDSRPVHADIVMFAKDYDAALKVQCACQERIKQVYSDASQLGPIPTELIDAFTVELNGTKIIIHVRLPDEMAKYFFTHFSSAFQELPTSSEGQISRNEPERPLTDDIPDPTPILASPN